jgi:hypothetical protein
MAVVRWGYCGKSKLVNYHQYHISATLFWSCIATHAYAWRVYHRQEHLFATLMLLCACTAEPAIPFIDTLGAYHSSRLAAFLAENQGRFISGEDLDRFSLSFSFSFCHHLQAQFRCRAVIIFVENCIPGLRMVPTCICMALSALQGSADTINRSLRW